MHGDFILKAARELELEPQEILDFASNINPFPPGDLEEVIIRAAGKCRYYPESSYSELKEVVADHLGCSRKEVVTGNGSIELIDAFFRLNQGKSVLIPYPTFTEYERCASIYGLRILHKPHSERILSNNDAEVSVICNPNNPTGELFSLKDFRAEKPFLIDEAFIDFVEDGEGFGAPSDGENFIIRSLTKILAIPGLRFGFGRFPESFAAKFERIRLPWHVNVIAMEVAIHYLPELRRLSRQIRKLVSREREWLVEKLSGMGLQCRGTANFLLVKAPFDAQELFKFLYSRGILIRTCNDFRGLDGRYFRIAVRSRAENERLVENIREFVELVESGKSIEKL